MTSKEQNIDQLEKALAISFKKQEEDGLPKDWQKGVMNKLNRTDPAPAIPTSTATFTPSSNTPFWASFGFFLFGLFILIFLWNFTIIDQFALLKVLLF